MPLAKAKNDFNARSSQWRIMICGAPINNSLMRKLLELRNLHEHKHLRHKLELPNIENGVGN